MLRLGCCCQNKQTNKTPEKQTNKRCFQTPPHPLGPALFCSFSLFPPCARARWLLTLSCPVLSPLLAPVATALPRPLCSFLPLRGLLAAVATAPSAASVTDERSVREREWGCADLNLMTLCKTKQVAAAATALCPFPRTAPRQPERGHLVARPPREKLGRE